MSRLAWVWAGAAAYGFVYSVLGTLRYLSFHSGSDLGIFVQSIASAFSGFSNTTEGANHFTYHFSPILYLCAPPLLLTHSPLALVVIQAIAGALAAPPLYLIAQRRVGPKLATGIALVAFLYPPLAGVTFADFHENGLVPAATLWLLWAVDARRWAWAAVALTVLLGIKEDEAPIVAFAAITGAVYFASRRDRAGVLFTGAALVLACSAFAFFFLAVRPWAGATEPWNPARFYGSFDASAHGGVGRLLLARLGYAGEAVIPLAFACLLTPAFIFVLPGFAEVLLSHDAMTYTMGQHYAAVWIGWILFAFALGVARTYVKRPRLAAALVAASAFVCALDLAVASPTHWRSNLALPNAHDVELGRILGQLPGNVSVGTQEAIYSHLGLDPNASLGLERQPQFALFDTTQRASYFVRLCLPQLQAGARRGTWHLVWTRDRVVFYRRGAR